MMLTPTIPAEMAEALGQAAARRQTVRLVGASSKRLMAGPVDPAGCQISTSALKRVIEYEPRDLTVSVEAGMKWRDLVCLVAANRQVLPLDPPFADQATVGGVIATNGSGPRRRLYGTARDLVIGMKFATLEGKLVQSGGMVVKNVAGLDMAKLMIGSFGTLAAVASVNFKLAPAPETERTFLLRFETLAEAMKARNAILASAVQPSAVDLLNPAAGVALDAESWLLAIRAGGSAAVLARYERELGVLADWAGFEGAEQDSLWQRIGEYTPAFLARHRDAAIVRVSCTLKGVEEVVASFPGAAIARAGTGVCYGYFQESEAAAHWMTDAAQRGWKTVIEFAPEQRKKHMDLWPAPGSDFEIMKRIKGLFDPAGLLNRGRLYGRI